MGIRLLKIAAVYLAIGVTMGLAMGIAQNFALHPVHAHVNLLGWATMALAGVIYVQFPQAAQTRLARIHFWIHNLALPVMMTALAFLLTGHERALYFLEPASTAMVVGLLVFVVNVCVNVRAAHREAVTDSRGTPARPITAVAAP
jgi:cbb3-type cytochrome oxidase subunit 1